MIDINSANYTAWEIRWLCLEGLPDLFMQKEALFLDDMLDLNPKNYQLWNYRRRFALKRGKVFEEEVKAAPTWSHASAHLLLCTAILKRLQCLKMREVVQQSSLKIPVPPVLQ